VTVVDTLKPVIALAYQGSTVHVGSAGGKGVNGETNPAVSQFGTGKPLPTGFDVMSPVRRRLLSSTVGALWERAVNAVWRREDEA
jgi:hypothetical protein